MPYLGRPVTNAGQFEIIDDISSSFNGSNTSFTLQVGGTNIQPDAANVIISLDGVTQIPDSAYSITGSTINFTEAPPSSTAFNGILAGQSQFIESGYITNTHISDSANISGSKINTDFSGKTIKASVFEGMISSSAQISTDISGSFTSPSSSFSTRVTNTETSHSQNINQDVKTSASPTFAGGTITGDFSVGGTITAQEFHSEFVSASIAYTSGSHKFGDSSDDVHSMTGSLNISGSLGINDGNVHVVDKMIVGSGSGFNFNDDSNAFVVAAPGNNAGLQVVNQTGGQLMQFRQSNNNAGDLILYGAGTTKVRFSSNGSDKSYINTGTNVGIGTTNPGHLLTVAGATDGDYPSIHIIAHSSDSGSIWFGESATNKNGGIEYDNSGQDMYFTTNSSRKMTLDTSGNLGIGTTNPLADLHVSGSNGKIIMSDHGQVTLEMQTNDTAAIFQRVLGSTNTSDINGGIFMAGNDTANVINFHVNYGGGNSGNNYNRRLTLSQTSASFDNCNVGIGTVSPSTLLDLETAGNTADGTYYSTLTINNTGSSTWSRIRFDRSGVAKWGLSLGTDDKFKISNLFTGGSSDSPDDEAFVLDNNSNVGIGTASPNGVLDIWTGSSRLFQVQGDGVGVGNNNPGNYGTLHVTGTGDTSITGSVFYDGYGEINVSGNVVGPHVLCLSSTAEASSDVGIEDMGPSMVFRGQPGTGLDGGATFAAIAGTLDQSNATYGAKGNLRFFTSAGYEFSPNYGTQMVERMRIDSIGNIGIGDTPTSSQRFYVKTNVGSAYAATFFNDGNNANRYGIRVIAGTDDGSGNNYHFSAMDGDGDLEGALRVDNGTFTLYDNSDRRLKDNIRDTEINGTDIVNSIKVRDFEWKKSGLTETAGFVAQELKESFEPASPDSEDDEYEGKPKMMAVSRDRLVPVLVKALQEAMVKIETLEAQMAQVSGSS